MLNFLIRYTILMFFLVPIWGFAYWISPPREISRMHGYRTRMSMQNYQTWRYAHKFYGKWAFILGIIIFALTIGTIVILKDTSKIDTAAYILIAVQAAAPFIVAIITEIALRKKFGDSTNRGMRMANR